MRQLLAFVTTVAFLASAQNYLPKESGMWLDLEETSFGRQKRVSNQQSYMPIPSSPMLLPM